ncbi:long-chain fatty acid--CoA ligase [Tenuibacillus multivorans]|uniref:Fatty-acyl-CoA synthase n=1 Tax=Tenuibacillus multivorans TaxID=237069 RepID=A0A1G9WED0_9BACI|nr:long-chain fatty acid--CoA ligase [Tenuibacillus multivorans]GEL76408.1 long-chain-fatty-acid--CoA ligase [Tenuibacillus multivorans]SDM82385.1 fatty-acyl-CoA synthase [Tenuibacillus multivorans]
MMEGALLINKMLERAEQLFPKKEIVSRTASGITRLNYSELGKRTRRLSSALEKLGVGRGDKVATLAWNDHRHLEAYFGIPSMGAVLHTINIRLSPQHIAYIINHAKDKVLLVDPMFLPILEAIKDELSTVEAHIILSDEPQLPDTTLAPLYAYEELLTDANPNYEYPNDLDEHDPAGMCYTSATTGLPKGVVYSHRGLALHSMALGLADSAAISESDVAMPVVPMFHANAWGMPFAATWYGSTQVLPGPSFTPELLANLITQEKVTITAGVPTIWLGLLKELDANAEQYDMSSLRAVLCGGSAAPKGMIQAFETKHKIPFIHAYGMTETTPLVTLSRLKSHQEDLPYDEKLEIRAKQGYVVPGLEIKVVNDDGEVEWNGEDMGELLVRGPWIAEEYYNDERSAEAFRDGWLYTGDIVTIDEEGVMKIADRTKDLVKSGGEWISTIDLENVLMAYEDVFEAAVVGVPHPEWQERPIAAVVLKPDATVSKKELFEFLKPQFANWWLPDDIIFMDEIPKTSVGKFQKNRLREQLQDYLTV